MCKNSKFIVLSASYIVMSRVETVNEARFAGLNICGFSTMKFFMGILSRCLGQQCLLFNYN